MDSFNLIPVPLPPMLPLLVGVSTSSRYFGLYYMATNATWSDGRSIGTFSFYGVYEPLINHIALDIHLWNCDLGSDDSQATHALLCERTEEKMYVAGYGLVEEFLESLHPPLPKRQPTKEEWSEIKNAIAQKFWQERDSDWQKQAMFEFLGQSSPKMQQKRLELVHWLDCQITKNLLDRYIQEAKIGNFKAIHQLGLLEARIKAGYES